MKSIDIHGAGHDRDQRQYAQPTRSQRRPRTTIIARGRGCAMAKRQQQILGRARAMTPDGVLEPLRRGRPHRTNGCLLLNHGARACQRAVLPIDDEQHEPAWRGLVCRLVLRCRSTAGHEAVACCLFIGDVMLLRTRVRSRAYCCSRKVSSRWAALVNGHEMLRCFIGIGYMRYCYSTTGTSCMDGLLLILTPGTSFSRPAAAWQSETSCCSSRTGTHLFMKFCLLGTSTLKLRRHLLIEGTFRATNTSLHAVGSWAG